MKINATTIIYLKRLIGRKIIRTAPTADSVEDHSYTSSPILIVGITDAGEIKYKSMDYDCDRKTRVLPIRFTDKKWVLYSKAIMAHKSKLNQWQGKRIVRLNPVIYYDADGKVVNEDYSYTRGGVVLVHACKNHLLVRNDFGTVKVLSFKYTNPKDWAVAD